MAVASWVYIWINGKILWTEQDALDFRSRSPKLTVTWWSTITVYCTGIQNIPLDQKMFESKTCLWIKGRKSRNDWKKIVLSVSCFISSMVWCLLLVYCCASALFFSSLSLSGFLDIFCSFSAFHPYGSCFVIPFVILFLPTFLLQLLHHEAVLHLLIFFIPFAWACLAFTFTFRPVLMLLLPHLHSEIHQCCSGCTDLVQHGHSAFVCRFETDENNVWHSQVW